MSAKRNETGARSTRRSFFLKGGALLAAPLAAAGPAAAIADTQLESRLRRLEDEAAIRELHRTWLWRINAGAADPTRALLDASVRGIAPDSSAAPDAIQIAADGGSAAGRYSCTVEIETGIARDCTLAQMAHAQGSGSVRKTERRVLTVDYLKTGGAWAIAKTQLAPI